MNNELILKVDNNSTYVEGKLESNLYKEFKKELGYLPENSFWMITKNSEKDNKKWKKEWDGYVSNVCWNKKFCKCSIKKDGIHFSTGLLGNACDFFKKNNIDYKLIDIRKKTEKTNVYYMSEEFEKRDYQQDIIDKITKGQGIDRGIIKCPTGSGKSGLACGIISGIGVSPTIFYVPSIDLLKQTKNEIERFIKRTDGKELKVGVVGGGEKDIQDITVMTIQTAVKALGGVWVKFDDEDVNEDNMDITDIKDKIKDLIHDCRLMIADECHLWKSETCQIISDHSVLCQYKFAMSVFPESMIELRGGCFSLGSACSIEEAWKKLYNTNEYNYCIKNGYEIIEVNDIESRTWNGKSFDWGKVKKFIKHINNKRCFSIRFSGKEKIKVTEDHSVFKIVNDKIVKSKPVELKNNDVILIDNGKNFSSNIKSLTALEILSQDPGKIRVALDLSKVSYKAISFPKWKYDQLCKRGYIAKKYGGSLYLTEYLKFKNILPFPKWLYTEGSNKCGISANLRLENISYLIGFYIGDGWVNDRINFAVEEVFLNEFLKHINSINRIKINPKIRKMSGKSYEVRFSCYPLKKFLDFYFYKIKCFDKYIPDVLLFNNEEIRRLLLKGLIDSDGSLKRTKENIKHNHRPCYYTTTSEKLKDNICLLLRSLNVQYTTNKRKPSLGGMINGRQIKSKRYSYQIIWSLNSLNNKNEGKLGNIKKTNIDCIEKKILEIKEIKADKFENSEYVYDIEMEGHPSFVANGVLVHNSATPYRDEGDDILIDACFGKTIIDINASYLIKKGYLVKPHIYFCEINNMRGMGKHPYQTVYKKAIVENEYRNKKIADFANYFKEADRKILVLVKQIEHGKILEEMIPDSVFLYGGTSKKKREKYLDIMREGKPGIIIASVIFDLGINVRPLDTLINAGSGKSVVRALQRIGRILRPYPGKKDAIVVDFMDNCKYLLSHSRKREKIYKSEEEFVIERPK